MKTDNTNNISNTDSYEITIVPSEIYLNAAEILSTRSSEYFCCVSIKRSLEKVIINNIRKFSDSLKVIDAKYNILDKLLNEFALYFKPDDVRMGDQWFFGVNYSSNGFIARVLERKRHRILCLILMAEIVKRNKHIHIRIDVD